MSLVLSKSLKDSDYEDLKPELETVDRITAQVGLTHPHTHRRWEYAMALKVLSKTRYFVDNFIVADFGSGVSPMAPIIVSLDVQLALYEIWQFGNESVKLQECLAKVKGKYPPKIINRGLGQLSQDELGLYDVSFCISTLEHIENEQAAFQDLCRSVKPKGMVFLTMDFAPQDQDVYAMREMRKRIYTESKLQVLVSQAWELGLKVFGGRPDWSWEDPPKVFDYSFASLALIKA